MSTLNPFLTQRYGTNVSHTPKEGNEAPPTPFTCNESSEGNSDDCAYDKMHKPSTKEWSSFPTSLNMVHKICDPLALTHVNVEKPPKRVEVLDSSNREAQIDIEKLISQTRDAMEAALATRSSATTHQHHYNYVEIVKEETSPFCCTSTTEIDEPKTVPDIQTRRATVEYSPPNVPFFPDKKVPSTDGDITVANNQRQLGTSSSPLDELRIQSSTTRALSYEPTTFITDQIHTLEHHSSQLQSLTPSSFISNMVPRTSAALEELTVSLTGDPRAILAKRVLRRLPLLVSCSYTDGEVQQENFGDVFRHTDECQKDVSPQILLSQPESAFRGRRVGNRDTRSYSCDGEHISDRKKKTGRKHSDNRKERKPRSRLPSKRDTPRKRSIDKKRRSDHSSNKGSRSRSKVSANGNGKDGIPPEALGVILSSIYAFATDAKQNQIGASEKTQLQNEEDKHQQELMARKRDLLFKQSRRYASINPSSKCVSQPCTVSSADFPKVNIPKSAESFFPIVNTRSVSLQPQQSIRPAVSHPNLNTSTTAYHHNQRVTTLQTKHPQMTNTLLLDRGAGYRLDGGAIPRYLLPTESWLSKGPELQGVHLHEPGNTNINNEHRHHWEHTTAPLSIKRSDEVNHKLEDCEINSRVKIRQSVIGKTKEGSLERLLKLGRNEAPPSIKHSYKDVHAHQVGAFNNNAGKVLNRWIAADKNNQ